MLHWPYSNKSIICVYVCTQAHDIAEDLVQSFIYSVSLWQPDDDGEKNRVMLAHVPPFSLTKKNMLDGTRRSIRITHTIHEYLLYFFSSLHVHRQSSRWLNVMFDVIYNIRNRFNNKTDKQFHFTLLLWQIKWNNSWYVNNKVQSCLKNF